MHSRICIRFGLVAGAATGLFINLLATPACCGAQAPLSPVQTVAYGILVAVVVSLIAAAFACLISRRPSWALVTVALLIALFTGALLGPVAYALPHPSAALIGCGLLGAIIGWLICWLLCRRRGSFAEAGR